MNTKATQIEHLTVADKVYKGESVCDGFYDSMTSLKNCDLQALQSDPNLAEQFVNFEQILKLCHDQPGIPSISLEDSSKLLSRMKKDVRDFYSVTAKHSTWSYSTQGPWKGENKPPLLPHYKHLSFSVQGN